MHYDINDPITRILRGYLGSESKMEQIIIDLSGNLDIIDILTTV